MQPVSRVRLEVDHLAHGWLTGAAALGAERRPLLASYLDDTPTALVSAARAGLSGSSAEVVFVLEPDSQVWRLEPSREPFMRLSISSCPSPWPVRGWEPSNEDEYLVRRTHFASAVVALLDDLLTKYTRTYYESHEGWGKPFPETQVAALRAAGGKQRPVARQRRYTIQRPR